MNDLMPLKRRMLRLTIELVSDCPHCVEIINEPDNSTPIKCTKWSGSSHPVSINPATCLSCGEYKKSRSFS